MYACHAHVHVSIGTFVVSSGLSSQMLKKG